MSKFTHYEACPKCQENGRDSRSDNLARYSDGGGHCFSCGWHLFSKLHIPEVKEEKNVNESVLPYDFTREVPRAGWQWLLQYGLGWKYWQKYCGYSPSNERLVFTVGEPTEFSIGRYVGTPKDGTRKWFVWGEAHKTPHVYGDIETAKTLVLCEDIVSAHKLAQVTAVIPLFGTNIFPSMFPVLRHIGLPITMWLDWDQQNNAIKGGARLSALTGLPVVNQFTVKDPKELSTKEIKEYLKL